MEEMKGIINSRRSKYLEKNTIKTFYKKKEKGL